MSWLITNSFEAVTGLVIAALVGFAAARFTARVNKAKSARHAIRGGPASHKKVLTALEELGCQNIYVPEYLRGARSLPLVVPPEFRFEPIDLRSASGLISLKTMEIDQLPEDKGVIERRRAGGTDLWNGDLIHAVGLHLSPDFPTLKVGRSTYFAYVTEVERVLTELWSSPSRRRSAVAPYCTTESAIGNNSTKAWLSGAVVTAIEGGGQPTQIVIHRRSSKTVNAIGLKTVAPVFGFDAATIGRNASSLGVTLYNLAREYAEEHFDKEDVVRANTGNWYDPDQIIDAIPELSTFLEDLDAGDVRGQVTGFCLNPRDCDLSIAFLIQVPRTCRSGQLLVKAMRGGWEAEAGAPGEPAVQLVDVRDDRLGVWASTGELYPSSAFALDRALAHLL